MCCYTKRVYCTHRLYVYIVHGQPVTTSDGSRHRQRVGGAGGGGRRGGAVRAGVADAAISPPVPAKKRGAAVDTEAGDGSGGSHDDGRDGSGVTIITHGEEDVFLCGVVHA